MGKLSPYFVNLSLLGLLSFSAVVAQDQGSPASETPARVLEAQKLLEEAKADEAIRILRSANRTRHQVNRKLLTF
jgi:hypothetical protein